MAKKKRGNRASRRRKGAAKKDAGDEKMQKGKAGTNDRDGEAAAGDAPNASSPMGLAKSDFAKVETSVDDAASFEKRVPKSDSFHPTNSPPVGTVAQVEARGWAGGERRKNIPPSETLFVVNFHEDTTSRQDLQMLFEPFGQLYRIDMKKNYAFVTYTSVEAAIMAKEAINGGKLDDSVITVEYVARKEELAIGTIVQVEARMCDGGDKPGGIGRITKVHTSDDGPKYDVRYVLGGQENGVDAIYVKAYKDEEQSLGTTPPTSPESLSNLAGDKCPPEDLEDLGLDCDERVIAATSSKQHSCNVYDEREGRTILPVTVAMVLNSQPTDSSGESFALVDGRQLHKVKLIGAVQVG